MTLGLMMRWLKTEIKCVNSWNNAKQGAGKIDKLMMQVEINPVFLLIHHIEVLVVTIIPIFFLIRMGPF